MDQNLSLEDDLGQVFEEFHDVSPKWYKIGLQLKVSPTCLDTIKKDESDSSDKLLEMLKAWLKKGLKKNKPKPTWAALVEALKSRTVGEDKEASRLEEKYCIAPETPSAATMTMADTQQPKGKANPDQQPQADSDTEAGATASSVQLQKSTETSTKRGSISTNEPMPKRRKVQDSSLVRNFPDKRSSEVNCSNAGKGCSWKGKLEELEHHRHLTCLKEEVACPYSEVGCEVRCLREELSNHQVQSQKYHLDQTIKTLKDELYNHPPLIIVMPNVTNQTEPWYSPPFYTSARGYKIQLVITPIYGDSLSVKVSGMPSDNDDHLKWPCCGTVCLSLRANARLSKNMTSRISFTLGASKAQPITPGSKIKIISVHAGVPDPEEIIIRDFKQYTSIIDNTLNIEISEVKLYDHKPRWILNPQAEK